MSETLKGNGSGNVPMIKFGDDFEKWNDERKINYLKRLASSMNHAADLMQKERNLALASLKEMKTVLEAIQENLEIQKKIVVNNLTADNAEKQELFLRIQDLERIGREKDKVIDQLRD